MSRIKYIIYKDSQLGELERTFAINFRLVDLARLSIHALKFCILVIAIHSLNNNDCDKVKILVNDCKSSLEHFSDNKK